ncbi:MAG: hypothetical protein WAP17_03925 [Bacteroidales bacterium]|jgi:hypothetical protein|nr:hypothetical protein [Bacteroidales bacterium]HPZ35623.1 hypothetical protein [Bacteroidales bacterium]HQD34081.1 hypothetical protein [Bacteroidales bacterium]
MKEINQQVNPENQDNKNTEEKPKKKSWFKQNVGATIVMIIMLIAIIFLGINLMVKQKQHKEEIADVNAKNTALVDSLKKDNFTWLTKVFTWTVRSEMLRENLEQVKLYSQEFIKYQYVDNIKVVDPSGRVIFSTDMKDQNVITEWSNIQKLAVIQQDNKIIIAAPVLGNNIILGAVVIEYKN